MYGFHGLVVIDTYGAYLSIQIGQSQVVVMSFLVFLHDRKFSSEEASEDKFRLVLCAGSLPHREKASLLFVVQTESVPVRFLVPHPCFFCCFHIRVIRFMRLGSRNSLVGIFGVAVRQTFFVGQQHISLFALRK